MFVPDAFFGPSVMDSFFKLHFHGSGRLFAPTFCFGDFLGKFPQFPQAKSWSKKFQKLLQPVAPAPARTFSTPLNWEGVPTVLGWGNWRKSWPVASNKCLDTLTQVDQVTVRALFLDLVKDMDKLIVIAVIITSIAIAITYDYYIHIIIIISAVSSI